MALLVLFYFSLPDNKPRLIFCNVGQGDGAVLVRGTFEMLLDTGPPNGMMAECLSKYLPFWDKTIEMVVLSHMDSDHSGGLAQIQRYYKVVKVLSNEQNSYSEKLSSFDVIRSSWFAFDVVSAADGATDNDRSVVGILKVGGKSVLFTSDAGREVEQRLVWREILRSAQNDKNIDILKVSHHGSAEGTSEELLEVIQPRLAIVSVGKNSYGHPTKVVLDRLKKFGVEIWRTDVQGEKIIEW